MNLPSIRNPWPLHPVLSILLMAGLCLAQSTVMPYARLGFAEPLLPLLAVVSWAMLLGPLAGAWWAIVAGLIMDVLSPARIGAYSLPLLIVVGMVFLARGRMFANNVFLPALLVAAATVVFDLAQRSVLAAGGRYVGWQPGALAEEMVPLLLLNLLWLPVIYFPLRALARQLERPRIEWERR